MDTKFLFFLFLGLLTGGSIFVVKDKTKLAIILLIIFSSLRNGIILYNYNGILLVDFPLIVLLILEIATFKNFTFLPKKVSGIYLFFIGWCIVVSLNTSWMQGWSFNEVAKFIRAYLIFIAVFNYLNTRKDISTVVTGLLLAVFMHSVIGVCQWRMGPLGLTFFEEPQFRYYRSYGLFVHPVMFADYLILIVPVVFRLFMFQHTQSKNRTLFYGAVFVFSAAALFSTFARGPWVGFILSMALMLSIDVIQKKFRYIKTIPLIMAIVFGSFFLIKYSPKIYERLIEDTRVSTDSSKIRMPLIKTAVRMIKAKPIFGTGLGCYIKWVRFFVVSDGSFDYDDLKQNVHNSYLLIAAEIGILGLVLYLLVVAAILKVGLKVAKSKSSLISNLGKGVIFGYLALLIEFMGGPDYRIHQILNTFWLLAGVVVGLYYINLKYQIQLRAKRILSTASQKVSQKG